MGVILGSGVVPIALCITWSKASRAGCVGGAVIGFVTGIAAWLGVTAAYNAGVINVTVRYKSVTLLSFTDINFICNRQVEVR
jgi:Na+/proline symporter